MRSGGSSRRYCQNGRPLRASSAQAKLFEPVTYNTPSSASAVDSKPRPRVTVPDWKAHCAVRRWTLAGEICAIGRGGGPSNRRKTSASARIGEPVEDVACRHRRLRFAGPRRRRSRGRFPGRRSSRIPGRRPCVFDLHGERLARRRAGDLAAVAWTSVTPGGGGEALRPPAAAPGGAASVFRNATIARSSSSGAIDGGIALPGTPCRTVRRTRSSVAPDAQSVTSDGLMAPRASPPWQTAQRSPKSAAPVETSCACGRSGQRAAGPRAIRPRSSESSRASILPRLTRVRLRAGLISGNRTSTTI